MGPNIVNPSDQYAENAAEMAILASQVEITENTANLIASQETGNEKALEQEAEENGANLGATMSKKLARPKIEVKSTRVEKVEESVLVRKEEADGFANEFSKRQGNREYRLNSQLLSQLASDLGVGIHEELSSEELIAFIRQRLTSIDGHSPDPVIVDKAFEFLLEFVQKQTGQATGLAKERFKTIFKNLATAKVEHEKVNAAAIQVGHKIIGAADAMVEETGKSIKEALTQCRDLVHNSPSLADLRKRYENIGYKAMLKELKALNTYLGGNFKRSNLEGAEISQLATAARKMQALLGVFRQFKIQVKTLENYLSLHEIFGLTPEFIKLKEQLELLEQEQREKAREQRQREREEGEREREQSEKDKKTRLPH